MHNMHEVEGNQAIVAIRTAYWMHACCVLASSIPLLGGCAVCIAYGTMLLMLLFYGVSDMSVHESQESQLPTCNALGTCSSCICYDQTSAFAGCADHNKSARRSSWGVWLQEESL